MDTSRAATAEALLAHASWMRALAFRLVRDTDRADDVVQQSFLAALERPPRHSRNLTGWLGRVVANRARELGRGDERRRTRERRAAVAEALPSTEELVVEAETQRRVVDAILRLDEPYRSTVLLRFHRGLSPAEIAQREGVAASTVRVRTARALALLRTSLDDGHGGDRHAWTRALAPAAIGLGRVALTAKSKGAIAAAVAAIVAAIVVTQTGGPGPAPPSPPPLVADAGSDSPEPRSDRSALVGPGATRTERTEILHDPSAEVPAPPTLSGRFVGSVHDPDGGAIEGATLRVFPKGAGNRADLEPLVTTRSDADGAFEVPVPLGLDSSWALSIEAEAEGHQSLTMDPILPDSPIAITLDWTATLAARVVEEESLAPIAGVTVSHGERTATSNADGRFELAWLPVAREVRIALRHPAHAITVRNVSVARHPSDELTLTMSRGLPLTMRVVDGDTGAPLPGAVVKHLEAYVDWIGDGAGRVALRVPVGESSTFRVDHPGYAEFTWYAEPTDPDEPVDVTIPMRGLAWIEGTLTNDAGEAIAGAWLRASTASGSRRDPIDRERMRELGLEGHARYGLASDAGNEPTDERGAFSIPVVPSDDPFTLTGGDPSLIAVHVTPLHLTEPGQRLTVDVTQARGGSIRGRVEYNGEPRSRGRITCTPLEGARLYARVDSDGTYRVDGVPAGRVEVELKLTLDRSTGVPDPIRAEVEVGETTTVDFVWSEPMLEIAGLVLDEHGEPAPGESVRARRRPRSGGVGDIFSAQTDADGRFELRVRTGDPYSVSAGLRASSVTIEGVAPGTSGLRLQLRAVATFALRFVDARTGSRVTPDHRDSSPIRWRYSGEEGFRISNDERVEPDRIVLEIPHDPTCTSVSARIDLPWSGFRSAIVHDIPIAAPGREAEVVEVRVERGLACLLRLEDPSDAALFGNGRQTFLLRDDELDAVRGPLEPGDESATVRLNGVLMWFRELDLVRRQVHFGDGDSQRIEGLLPGRYRLVAFPGGVEFEPGEFELNEDAQAFDVRASVSEGDGGR